MEFLHKPVLLNETIDGLDINKDGIYVDCTLGGGGHSLEIVKRLSSEGRLIAIDKDDEALASAKNRLKEYNNITYIHNDFKNVIDELDNLGIKEVDGVLLDLGVSSYQLDNQDRGFSYSADAPLDMRMDKQQSFSAYDVINGYDEKRLADVIYEYGEERFSRKIAYNIVMARKDKPIQTTFELARLIEKSIPVATRWKGGNPCKRTFQAIRIEVNSELDGLGETLNSLSLRLKKGGRLCVITFHSLEDRIAKRVFVELEKSCICPPNQPICNCGKRKEIEIITKKPIVANEKELEENSRAACAKLRIIKRI